MKSQGHSSDDVQRGNPALREGQFAAENRKLIIDNCFVSRTGAHGGSGFGTVCAVNAMKSKGRFWIAWLLIVALFGAGASAAKQNENVPQPAGQGDGSAGEALPLLVVFDFESTFDNDKLGRKAAEMFRGHAFRSGEFTMLDPVTREEVAAAVAAPPFNLQTSPVEAAEIAAKFLDAQIAIWGRVERLRPDEYLLHVRILDRRDDPAALALQKSYTSTYHGIQVSVDKVLDEFLGTRRQVKKEPLDDDSWLERRNLCANGGFEVGDLSPARWERVDGLCTFWVDSPDGDGKCIMIDTDVNLDQYERWLRRFKKGAPASKAPTKTPTVPPKYDTVGGITGAHLYSDPIPIRQGVAYRADLFLRGPNGNAKCFVKGYSPFYPRNAKSAKEGAGPAAEGVPNAGNPSTRPAGKPSTRPAGKPEYREVYRAQINLKCETDGAEWEHFAMIFHPSQPFLMLTIRSDFDGGRSGEKLRKLLDRGLRAQGIVPMIDSDEAVKRIRQKNVAHLITYDASKYQVAKVVHNLFGRAAVVWGNIVKKGAGYETRIRMLDVRHATATTKDLWAPPLKTSLDGLETTSSEILKTILRNARLVAYLRVKLDAYWPPGTYYFDNVWITEEPAGKKQ